MGFISEEIGDTLIVSSDNRVTVVLANDIINGLEKIYNKKFHLFKGYGLVDPCDERYSPYTIKLMYIAQSEIKEELNDDGDGTFMPYKYEIIGTAITDLMYYKGEYYFQINDTFGDHDDKNIRDNNIYKIVSEKAIDISLDMFNTYAVQKGSWGNV